MQDSSALAEGAEIPPSVVRQIAAERARLEDDREVLWQEREGLKKEKEEQAKANADLTAQLAALFAQNADLEKRLLSLEGEVMKLRKEAGVIPKLKYKLGTFQEASSKILLDFLSSNAFQVAALNLAKPAMLDQLHTTLSYISELFPFKPEEFGVTETVVEPPSFTGFK
jgi:septal ring factor EnvC (AmiA/AmiB activator)